MKTIFVVDDSDTNLSLAKKALEDYYRVLTMPSASKMFELLEKITPDMILLDIEMPQMDGFEALRRLKSSGPYAGIPVIFLTAYTDIAIEVQGFELGAVDFIAKPFSTPVLQNRIKTHLDIDAIIRERTAQLRRLQNGIIFVLADLVESRDRATGGHIARTTGYIKILIKAMEERRVYADELSGWDFETTISSARLHDVGKIGISDLILNKPGDLTKEEYEKIKSHTMEGERIVDKIIALSGDDALLQNAKLFAGYHHEHWDGTGYPRELKGTDIPLQGRVMAVADVYDALVSRRSYKEAFTDEETARIMISESGKLFDPKIIEVFSEVQHLFKEVTMGWNNETALPEHIS